jgi:hypothetical protein
VSKWFLITAIPNEPNLTGQNSVYLWDPEKIDWAVGNLVLIARDPDYRDDYKAFLAVITGFDEKHVRVKLDDGEETSYQRFLPGTSMTILEGSKASIHRETVRKAVERQLQSTNLKQQAEGLLLKHGNVILSHLYDSLKSDSQFIGVEGRWYLVDRLTRIEVKTLKSIHQLLLQRSSFILDDVALLVAMDGVSDEVMLKMSIQAALLQLPERFENLSMTGRPQWRALPPKPEQAKILYYVYDPQTYEVLCCPGQDLSKKSADRLQEINVYSSVVIFREENA